VIATVEEEAIRAHGHGFDDELREAKAARAQLFDDELLDETETAAEFLARLKVAVVTGTLPEDVGRWAVEAITETLPATARRMARDRHLRTAVSLLTGSAWSKARRLEQEIRAVRGQRAPRARVRPQEATVSWHVRQALAIDPETPASMRHLLRVVTR
jgi:hypothetical protein